jgi:soluble lytic murein transglycosylase-like protein
LVEGTPNRFPLATTGRWILWIGLVFFLTMYPREGTDTQFINNINELEVRKLKIVRKPVPHDHSPFDTCDVERRLQPLIVAASLKHQVDPALVKAIIMAESGYDPSAVSERGAVGLMQLMPNTADAFGVKDSFDPAHNINGGVQYLSQLINHFEGDVRLAVAAYNAGIDKIVKHKTFPKSTQRFVKKVLAYYQHYQEESPQWGSMI